tara:strand:- start:3046 stop:3315 length:270 start_codon:yes stop_codon:yes gene_type:complete
MILFLSESDFNKFDEKDNNKISNFFNLKDKNIERPLYKENEQDTEISFIVKDFLNPSYDLDLEPVYKKNIRIKDIKCLDDNIYKYLLNK